MKYINVDVSMTYIDDAGYMNKRLSVSSPPQMIMSKDELMKWLTTCGGLLE